MGVTAWGERTYEEADHPLREESQSTLYAPAPVLGRTVSRDDTLSYDLAPSLSLLNTAKGEGFVLTIQYSFHLQKLSLLRQLQPTSKVQERELRRFIW